MAKVQNVDQEILIKKPGIKIMKKYLVNLKSKNIISSIKHIFYILFICCMCGTTNSAIQYTSYVTDINIALELAQSSKLDLLVIFSADWCGNCQKLKNDLNNISGFDNYILCIVDVDHKDNKALVRKLKIKSMPTSIIFDQKMTEQTRLVGYNKVSYEKWLLRK